METIVHMAVNLCEIIANVYTYNIDILKKKKSFLFFSVPNWMLPLKGWVANYSWLKAIWLYLMFLVVIDLHKKNKIKEKIRVEWRSNQIYSKFWGE